MSKLILIIILLTSAICSAQVVTMTIQQAEKAMQIKAERDSLLIVTADLSSERDSMKSENKGLRKKLTYSELANAICDSINVHLNNQIEKFENTPIVKEVIKTKWYVWLGVIVSSIATGIIIDRIAIR